MNSENIYLNCKPIEGITALHRVFAAIVLFMLGAVFGSANAANIYRYEDENGNLVYNSVIPAEYVKKGYTILNDRGQVIEVVPRALTAEEKVQREAERERERQAELVRQQQQERDNLLLRLYRNPQEVEKKREEKLAELEARRIPLQASVDKNLTEIADIDARQVRAEDAGVQLAEKILMRQAQLREDNRRYQEQLERLHAERREVISSYDADVKRLRELMGL